MGTNYYAVRNRPTVEHPIHIGKSSGGWLFLFHQVNEPYYEPPVIFDTYDHVIDWLKKYTVDTQEYVILDEYDKQISLDDFIDMVQRKQNDPDCRDNPENFKWVKDIDGYRFDDREFWQMQRGRKHGRKQ